MHDQKIRRALLSVYDKTGIEQFAKALVDRGVEIISSGGTAKALQQAGIPVRFVQEWTGFPEMLGHRVVTLHPKVHGAILANRDDPQHKSDIEKYGLEPLDLVCVSLYPFEDAIAKPGATLADAIEMIDIGGPTLIRASAKNHKYVTVVTEPAQYEQVLGEMAAKDGAVSFALRQKFALKAFALTCHYDSIISAYLRQQTGEQFPDRIGFSFTKTADLRYGENAHQKAAFYVSPDACEPCVARAKLLGGKSISYNNYFDANGAIELVKEFDKPAVAIIKHANPAGCAVDDNLVEAYRKAYYGDVNAAMGGIIAVNRPVSEELAAAVVETYKRWGKDSGAGGFFAEIIIAPSFEGRSLEIIQSREGWGQDVRLLATGPLTGRRNAEKYIKYVVGGAIIQDRDLVGLNEQDWKVVTKRQPTPAEMDDLRFAWLVCKHVKSNAIVLAKGRTLLGAGAGQMSRVNSARLAGMIAAQYGGGGKVETAGCVLASDAFFPFPDSLDWARDAGAAAVIEPGGGKKDEDVIARADELGLAMVFTQTRHFNH
ncbi:MAG: bifunctional phosphoribosylaminoimidazolecarboxamide formyltransferase/IMP cyclohydrolase [Planctomycetaceae bacterium]|nr:bifunctional phosphoribosylaminoimidazolecarboxamide formyltransferase/IMP cyclohydrolase [Planctomycetaceae bacterium]